MKDIQTIYGAIYLNLLAYMFIVYCLKTKITIFKNLLTTLKLYH